ncbi:hypothetical protein [Photobacterium damselae]|uniref:hypothetical protein n=1 Tax=Photobacterium damselae TaxID=38293 RepID=UPI001F3C5AF3|nr:hypothetical protein [Photobacterium damselae]UKA04747.1 hypothetical protein IHC89_21130 [Photobacterium damselae subsp. damselae]
MKSAVQPLVNHKHGIKQAHVLAKSGNLYVEVNNEFIPLRDFIKTRADMPDDVNEVFNPEVCEDWDVNFDYLSSKENMICRFDGINFECLHFDDHGDICGLHPDAIKDENGNWVLPN